MNVIFSFILLLEIAIFLAIIDIFFVTNIIVYIIFIIFCILSIFICFVVPEIFDYIYNKKALLRLKEKLDDKKWHKITYVATNNYTDRIISENFDIPIEDISKFSFKALFKGNSNSIIVASYKINGDSNLRATKSYYLFEQLFEIS